ncbi:hypothetical protein ACHAWX_004455 [Stephanocyclus meneghinianus]
MKLSSYSIIPCLVWNLPFAPAMLLDRPRSTSYTTLPVAFNTRAFLSLATLSHHHERMHYLSGAWNHPRGIFPSRTYSKRIRRRLPSASLWAQQPLRGGDAGDRNFDGAVDSLIGKQTAKCENEELTKEARQLQQNSKYIKGLIENLEGVLDKWIISGSLATRRRAYNILHQIQRLAMDPEQARQAMRMVNRAGMPMDPPPLIPPTEHVPADQQPSIVDRTVSSVVKPMGPMSSDEVSSCGSTTKAGKGYTPTSYAGENRIDLANERLEWEKQQVEDNNRPRSALSARMATHDGRGDPFLSNLMEGEIELNPFRLAKDKQQLQETMNSSISAPPKSNFQKSINTDVKTTGTSPPSETASSFNLDVASAKASELVARAGSGSAFQGTTLGIGGLDDVLSQIQRRVWIPLAAPPSLLRELGIQPVRGVLLYGSPGCGKTLLARKLGSILSPARPITIVSGPEIMDKFVGSSEKNLREIFDNPPELYFEFKKNYGEPLGGSGGKGDQGDAGVARDSVVNQLLAKMDGVDPLSVPTLLIGLTNKPSLIDPALMRPGRFEVKIEVPKPKTVEQRASILRVHTSSMMNSGRVLVRDAPVGSASWRQMQQMDRSELPTYDELVDLIAIECDGMSGASLAGVARAAASRALERAVTDFVGHVANVSNEVTGVRNTINDCLVTQSDFEKAVDDVFESARVEDHDDRAETAPSKKVNLDTSESLAEPKTETAHVNADDETLSTDSYEAVSDLDGDDLRPGNDPGESESKHETYSENFRAGVEIPNWGDRFYGKDKSLSLRDLLPKRKTTWLKLDKFGRRIEDTSAK